MANLPDAESEEHEPRQQDVHLEAIQRVGVLGDEQARRHHCFVLLLSVSVLNCGVNSDINVLRDR